MNIFIGPDGKVAMGIDNQKKREELLDKIAKVYGKTFTKKQIEEFGLANSFAVPIGALAQSLDRSSITWRSTCVRCASATSPTPSTGGSSSVTT